MHVMGNRLRYFKVFEIFLNDVFLISHVRLFYVLKLHTCVCAVLSHYIYSLFETGLPLVALVILEITCRPGWP